MTVLRVGADVAWLETGTTPDDEPEVAVARVPAGPPHALRGASALIWLAAAEGGTSEEVIARVASAAGRPADIVGDDVRRLLDDLVNLGLLARER